MALTEKDVRKIAELNAMAVSDDEVNRYLPQLDSLMNWVEQLGEVNTDGIEPLASVNDGKQRLRVDIISDGNMPEKVLANAPEEQAHYYVVPKVIE